MAYKLKGRTRIKYIDVDEYNWTFGTDCKTEKEVLQDCYFKVGSKREVGAILGVHEITVASWLLTYGIPNVPFKISKPEKDLDVAKYNKEFGTEFITEKQALAHCYTEQGGIEGVAKCLKLSASTVSTRFKKLGIDIHTLPKNSCSKVLKKILEIPHEKRKDMTYTEIAGTVGCDPVHAWRMLKKHNLSFRRVWYHGQGSSAEKAEDIRQDRESGMTYEQLIKKHKVCSTKIAQILRGET
jgi:hypothetical protein